MRTGAQADDALRRLGRVGRMKPEEASEPALGSSAAGAVAGSVGGAVLGGLLLGPFGAIFGANLGGRWGGQAPRGSQTEGGLDKDMVLLAKQVARELSEAMESRERVLGIRDGAMERVAQLEASVQAKYEDAMQALKADDESRARAALEAKLGLSVRLEAARADLARAERQMTAMDISIGKLEARALEVARLLERAQAASGAERTALASEASGSLVRDPLLEKFAALERSRD